MKRNFKLFDIMKALSVNKTLENDTSLIKMTACFVLMIFFSFQLFAWEGMAMPELKVKGNQLVDSHGNVVKLHGFAQTYSPWFNERGQYWTNYDVNGCLNYNQRLINEIMAAGWEMNFLRLHMDPYWSNRPGSNVAGEHDISAFDFDRFKAALDNVFIPMAEYAISKGMYVVMRPPGVCPENIAVGDAYNQYLIQIWTYVAQHSKLKNHPNIMFELANEPIRILGPDGTYGNRSQGHFDNLKIYFQSIVDAMRNEGCNNILWIPGLAYQSIYSGYAVNPIDDDNIGYAVHIYPGWFGSGEGYENFQKGWDEDVQPVADMAPVMITEMDWADAKYDASWGKAHTGVAGGDGFGANFKKITDDAGNVSWLLFTSPEYLARFDGIPPAPGEDYTFLNDPEACPWPIYHWYKDYALDNYPRPDFTYRSHSDNGDGTYTNPIVFGDFPDPDVIRVDDVYYMVSTTMHIFPGATILKSYDLVNWEYCCNPLQRIELTDGYNLDNGQDRYSKGQWASALQYKNGTFYLLFTTLDEGSYLLTTTEINGTWDKKKLNDAYYDPGLLFDPNGKNYIVYGINHIRIAEVDDDFVKVPDGDKEVVQYSFREGLEGSHLYKIGEYYYIYATYGGWPAFQTVFRSKNVYGPYEEKKLIDDDNIHQGALVQTQTGEWWTVLFYDKGPFGRFPNLQPVTWVNDWPEIGVNGAGVTTYRKPNVGREYGITSLPTNDNFRHYELGMQWGWNHNPDPSKWSLIENAGSLRLYTANVVEEMHQAKNTLTQRILGYQNDMNNSFGTIKLEVEHMINGDIAGISVFQDPYAYIGVKMKDGVKKLIYDSASLTSEDKAFIEGIEINQPTIYLRAVAGYLNGKANFYYSLDNINFIKFGNEFEMKYDLSMFTGNKFAIFNYATQTLGGYVDIDWFSTEPQFNESIFYDDSFTGYSEESLTLTDIIIEEGEDIMLLTGSSMNLTINAVYADGHMEDITMTATYTVGNPDVLSVVNGRLIALKDGVSMLSVYYQGVMGEAQRKEIWITATTFPLTNALLNPSIWTTGSFDESTQTLITGQYGFGGWIYNNGIDMSAYNYVVVKLQEVNNCGASFRLFDENNYWSSAAMYDMGNQTQLVVQLQNAYKENGVKLDPSHIYIAGFWSYGGCPIKIEDVYLTDSDDYEKPSGMEDAEILFDPIVDVYTVYGIKVLSQIYRSEAIRILEPGIYIIGNEKIMILR